MKKGILFFLILAINIASYSQQKNYGTKIIGQWTFEKFPLNFSVTPSKALSYKDQRTGKLEGYEEFNQFGQTNGLKLEMCTDGIYPYSAVYMYKGEIVYDVTFFPNSKIASSIATYNDKGQKDGYVLNRHLKDNGGYTENIEKYDNDVLVELNGVKQAPISIVFKDSLLDGKFKFENSLNWIIEGEAEMGKLKKIKQTQEGKYFMCEITFLKDSIKVKEPKNNGEGFTYETYPMITNPSITNSKSFCMKYGNYSGYPYLLMPEDFDIRDLEELVQQFFPAPFETKVNFKDSLLDGDFQYRQYIYSSGGYSYSSFMNVYGKAEMGKLLNISTIITSSTGVKKIKYTFQDNKILQNDYVPELPNEPVSSLTYILEYPVLLTNSITLGGKFKLKNDLISWDSSPDNPKNIFGTPHDRAARLEENKYGYVYFSPFSFDISNYLEIVTTKTEKPVENKTVFNNGFLDGYFDFKEDGIQFTGVASTGLIQSMKIKCDFETSKDIVAPDTDWNGRTIYFDCIELQLNSNSYSYDVKYITTKQNKITYEVVIPFTKIRKITNLSNLSGYDNFVVFDNYQNLRGILYGMKYIDKNKL